MSLVVPSTADAESPLDAPSLYREPNDGIGEFLLVVVVLPPSAAVRGCHSRSRQFRRVGVASPKQD